MGIFNRKKSEERASGEVQIEDSLLRAFLGFGPVTKEMALQVPTVSGGIDLIAGIIAETPIKLYRDEGGKAVEVKDDPRIKLLNDETGDTLNANEFWRAMVSDYYLGKGGYAYICKSRGKYKSLHYVPEENIAIDKSSDPIFKDYDILVGGKRYKPFDFLKILRNTKDGAQGCPITEENSRLIAVAYQSLKFEYSIVKRGGNKRGYYKSEKRLGPNELNELKAAVRRLFDDETENAIVLNNGVEFIESSNTAAEMQLNENKKANAEEFSKIFHVSADAIAGKSKDIDSLAKLAAIPLMVTIQCALNRDLLLEKEKGLFYWAFDTKDLLKGTIKDRFEAYKTALDANFMQIDEVRFAEDLEPLGLNWIKLGLQDVLYDPNTKTVYTPNTNQTNSLGKQASENENRD